MRKTFTPKTAAQLAAALKKPAIVIALTSATGVTFFKEPSAQTTPPPKNLGLIGGISPDA